MNHPTLEYVLKRNGGIRVRRMALTDAWKIAATYIGTVVGAGFASGQEVMQFFTRFGSMAIISIFLTTVLFYLLGAKVMQVGRKTDASSFGLVISSLVGEKFGKILQIIMLIMLCGVTITMVAGSGALLYEQLHIPIALGSLLTVILTGIVLSFGMRGVISANSFIVPIMIIFIVIVFLSRVTPHDALSIDTTISYPLQSVLSALSYVGFNVGLSLTVLIPLGKQSFDKRTLQLGALFGAIALGVMLLFIHLLLVNTFHGPFFIEIPMGYIAKQLPPLFRLLFIGTLWAEIFSTLVSNVYGMAHEMVQHHRRRYLAIIAMILALTFFGSQIGFSTMVSHVYPIFGYIGIVMLVAVLV